MAAEKEIEAMVVICPKCKVKLKVAEEKIAPQGTRFKCPKCAAVLLVKRPAVRAKPLDKKKVLIGHENPLIMEKIRSLLVNSGFGVIPAADGIEAMVNAAKELPFLSILSVSLPKIYGFEVALRLKKKPETRDMKIILVASLYDKDRYRREPATLHGADDYIEEHQIEAFLLAKIASLSGKKAQEPGRPERAGAAAPQTKVPAPEPEEEKPSPGHKEPAKPGQPIVPVEKARRLARTIVSDIYLYNKAKVDEAIKKNAFHAAFASDLKEGLKLYESRVPAEVKKLGDFFNEEINHFIAKRKEKF